MTIKLSLLTPVALATMLLISGCGGNDVATPAASSQSTKLLALTVAPTTFGVTEGAGYLTVNTGAGLVFKVRQAGGDITSIRYKDGPELQSQTKSSHISSGLGATTEYSVVNGVIKLTLTTSSVKHYMLMRQNENTIYMATHITAQPTIGELRWITRLNGAVLNQAPLASSLLGTVGPLESADIFGSLDGTTASKYYGNQRAIDMTLRGVTGTNVGVFMAYGNRESSSGGPFFRDIQNQTGLDTEVYNYMNSGHAQTEQFRLGLHGPYALMFTNGTVPAAVPNLTWMGAHNLEGWVPAAGRGKVIGNGFNKRDLTQPYTVGFENATAQYWTKLLPNGSFSSSNMKAGTYNMTLYKGELAVHRETVTVWAGGSTTLRTRTINDDPAAAPALWCIGQWDGTPTEFKNGESLTQRHPSDVRNLSWGPVNFAVGSPASQFPAAQWKSGVNGPTTVTFNLTPSEIRNRTVRIGITTAFGGARPSITLNGWSSPVPAASAQPVSRGLTIGTYRGNNTRYTYDIPASAFVAGTNTMTLWVASGSNGERFLSPAFAYDAVDML